MRLLSAGALLLATASLLPASIVFTYEAPGVQQTSVSGAITENFNSFTPGAFGPYVSPVGTYSTGGAIVNPNLYGGANQTRYISVGTQSGALQYSLTFNGLQGYFGFNWQAVDTFNQIDFYQGANLQATFTPSTITSSLSSAYYGNPNTGENPFEVYVYLNFTATDNASRFDRVVFRNQNTLTGFETDNHSVFSQVITPPAVPEPSTYALIGSGLVAVWLRRRKRA